LFYTLFRGRDVLTPKTPRRHIVTVLSSIHILLTRRNISFLQLLLLLSLDQCRRAPVENTRHRLCSDVSSMYSRSTTTVTSSAADDISYDAVDDEDDRRVPDDDLEHSGSGDDVASRNWDRKPFSDSAPADSGTRPRTDRSTPILLYIQRFRQTGDDVAMTTRRTAAASSSTSWRRMTSLVVSVLLHQLALTASRTRYLVLLEYS